MPQPFDPFLKQKSACAFTLVKFLTSAAILTLSAGRWEITLAHGSPAK